MDGTSAQTVNAARDHRQRGDATITAVPFELAAQARALGKGLAAVERWVHGRIDNGGPRGRSYAHD